MFSQRDADAVMTLVAVVSGKSPEKCVIGLLRHRFVLFALREQ